MWSASPAPSGPTSSPSLAAATAGATVDTRTTTGRAYSYGVAMSTTRYIGRANIAKRLSALDGSAGRAVYRDGSATFELDEAALSVTPPFGLEHVGEYDVVRAGPLLDALEIEPRVAVLLVRMGGYAVGVLDGERLVASKVGTRFVKGRHKKGGSSSNRFRRRREEQARALIEEAAEVAVRVLEPWRGRVEFVALGGDRGAISEVLAASPQLGWLAKRAIPRFFTVPE